MSTPPSRPRRLSTGATVLVAVLLLIPCVALALVPTYSRETPKLWGWPFFYWYQVLWVLITPVLTYAAFKIIQRARGEK
jgi:cation transport ATPase